MKTIPIHAALVSALIFAAPASADPEVAYVEEITVDENGNEVIERYHPADKPVRVAPPVYEPRQRGLNDLEKQEIARLEEDFAHGQISESEYYQRKRDIYRATFIDGDAPDDGMLNFSGTF